MCLNISPSQSHNKTTTIRSHTRLVTQTLLLMEHVQQDTEGGRCGEGMPVKTLVCSLCDSPARDAQITVCQHVFCLCCLMYKLPRNGVPMLCPGGTEQCRNVSFDDGTITPVEIKTQESSYYRQYLLHMSFDLSRRIEDNLDQLIKVNSEFAQIQPVQIKTDQLFERQFLNQMIFDLLIRIHKQTQQIGEFSKDLRYIREQFNLLCAKKTPHK